MTGCDWATSHTRMWLTKLGLATRLMCHFHLGELLTPGICLMIWFTVPNMHLINLKFHFLRKNIEASSCCKDVGTISHYHSNTVWPSFLSLSCKEKKFLWFPLLSYVALLSNSSSNIKLPSFLTISHRVLNISCKIDQNLVSISWLLLIKAMSSCKCNGFVCLQTRKTVPHCFNILLNC